MSNPTGSPSPGRIQTTSLAIDQTNKRTSSVLRNSLRIDLNLPSATEDDSGPFSAVSNLPHLQLRYSHARLEEADILNASAEKLQASLIELERIWNDGQVLLEGMRLIHDDANSNTAATTPVLSSAEDHREETAVTRAIGATDRLYFKKLMDLLESVQLDLNVYQTFLQSKLFAEYLQEEQEPSAVDPLDLQAILAEKDEPIDADLYPIPLMETAIAPIVPPAIQVEEPETGTVGEGIQPVQFSRLDAASFDDRLGRLRTSSMSSLQRVSVTSERATSGSRASDTSSIYGRRRLESELKPDVEAPFKWSDLAIINDQLAGLDVREQYGLATLLQVRKQIAIATNRGYILLFDFNQRLRLVVGNPVYTTEYGQVTAFDICPHGLYMAVGHARGAVSLWLLSPTVQLYKVLARHDSSKTKENQRNHSFQSTIISISFSDVDPLHFITGDNQGLVCYNIIQQTFLFNRVDTFVIANENFQKQADANSTVYAAKFLRKGTKEHETDEMGVAALLLSNQTKPQLRHVVKFDYQQSTNTHCGCLAWCSPNLKSLSCASIVSFHIYSIEKETNDPWLAFSWDNILALIQIKKEATDNGLQDLKFSLHSEWKCPEEIAALVWIHPQLLVVVGANETLFLYHPEQKRLLEQCKSRPDQHILSFRASKDSAYTFSNAVESRRGRLLILGDNRVHVGLVLSWKERLDLMRQIAGDTETLKEAILIYTSVESKAMSGLPADREKRYCILRKYVRGLLDDLISAGLASYTEGSMYSTSSSGILGDLIPICIDTCVTVNDGEYLYTTAYERLKVFQSVFLQSLVPMILQYKIKSLPPEIMNDFVEEMKTSQFGLERLEECLTALDYKSFDIDHIIRIAKQAKLSNTIVYVYCYALQDFITPIHFFLQMIENDWFEVESGRVHENVPDKYKVFAYLASIIRGQVFTFDMLGEEVALKAKRDVHSFLLAETVIDKYPINFFATYPYLKVLLKFDTHELLKVLSLAFEDQFLDGNQSLRDENGDVKHTRQSEHIVVDRQYWIDTLINVLTRSVPSFPQGDILNLYCFIVRSASLYSSSILISEKLYIKMLDSFLEIDVENSENKIQEFQIAVNTILGQYQPSYDEEIRLAQKLEKCKYWSICIDIYARHRMFSDLIRCLTDSSMHSRLFEEAQTLLLRLPTDERGDLVKAIISNATILAEIDHIKMASLVAKHLQSSFQDIVNKLTKDVSLTYKFMKYFDQHSHEDISLKELFTKDLVEKYVGYMCQEEPSNVHNFLRTTTFPYNSDVMIKFTQKYRLLEASVWLFESSGKYREALDILLQCSRKRSSKCVRLLEASVLKNSSYISDTDQRLLNSWLFELQGMIKLATFVCQRASLQLQKSGEEDLWFSLLEFIIELQIQRTTILASLPASPVTNNQSEEPTALFGNGSSSNDADFILEVLEVLRHYLHLVLDVMKGYISNSASLLTRLVSSSAIHRKSLMDFREMFESILTSYREELRLLQTTNQIQKLELLDSGKHLRAEKRSGFTLARFARGDVFCAVCGGRITSAVKGGVGGHHYLDGFDGLEDSGLNGAVMFRCGHCCHSHCVAVSTTRKSCFVCNSGISAVPNQDEEKWESDNATNTLYDQLQAQKKFKNQITRVNQVRQR